MLDLGPWLPLCQLCSAIQAIAFTKHGCHIPTHTKKNLFALIRIDVCIGMEPNSINMDLRSVCFPSVCAIVCHSIAVGFLACLVSVGGPWQLRTPERSASNTCRKRESWDVDDRRTDEHTVDNVDWSEDERDCGVEQLVTFALPCGGHRRLELRRQTSIRNIRRHSQGSFMIIFDGTFPFTTTQTTCTTSTSRRSTRRHFKETSIVSQWRPRTSGSMMTWSTTAP